jgi:hypothetical protein
VFRFRRGPGRVSRQCPLGGQPPSWDIAAEDRLHRQVDGELAEVAPGLARVGGSHPLVELIQVQAAGRIRVPQRGHHGIPVDVRGANGVIGGHGHFFSSGGKPFSWYNANLE